MTLAITGSTGAIGGRVARRLADLQPRLIVRDASRAPEVPGSEVAVATYADTTAAEEALAGVDVLLMVSASESEVRRDEHRAFIAAAAGEGVGHIVYTSLAAAAPDATFTLGRDHHDAEQAIRDSGMTYTFLRDNFYADFIPTLADEHGVIRGPAGTGLFAPVARADVADVAAAVLRSPADHADTAYELTGPEAFTMAEAATRAGAVLGRQLRYEEESLEGAYASRRAAYAAPDWQLDAWVSTYTAIADGSFAHVSDDVRRITGHAPLTIEQTLSG